VARIAEMPQRLVCCSSLSRHLNVFSERILLCSLQFCYYLLSFLVFNSHESSPLTTREAAWFIMSADSDSLSDDNFRKPWRRKFISANPVYLHWVRVKFVCERHWVKVKVTGAKKSKTIQYSRNGNLRARTNPDPRSVKIPFYNTPRLPRL